MTTSDLSVLRRLVVLGAIALTGIVLAGCGSSSSPNTTETTATTTATATTTTTDTATTSAALTREQLVAKLDDICKRGNAVAASYQTQYREASAAGDYTRAANAREQNLRAQAPLVAEFEKLVPPPELRAAFTRYKTAQDRLTGLDVRVIAALRARDRSQLVSLAGLVTDVRKQRTEAAIDLGTKNCGM